MKNKIRLIVVLSLVTIVAALFSGCFLSNFNRVKSISLVGTPKTTYYVGDSFDADGLKIQVNYINKSQASVIKNFTEEDFIIDFKSDKVGTYKCTVTLKANANISLSFDYSVIEEDGTFTEGDGSQSSPYVVYTAEQFSHIGDMAGQYYVLGDNVDLTKVAPAGKDGMTFYNTNVKSFALDGKGYTLLLGGEGQAVFQCLKDAQISNLTVNIKPGSADCTLSLWTVGSVAIDHVTFNGTMGADGNSGLVTKWARLNEIVVSNCVNNVNIIGGNTVYFGAFIGLATPGSFNSVNYSLRNASFINCVNNGNLEGNTAWIFIGNGAHNFGEVNIENCRNNGKLVGAGVGLLNYTAGKATETRLTKESFEKNVKINKFSFECNANDFVKVSGYLMNGEKDVTLVNADGTVKFNSSIASKLAAEFSDGYTVKAYVRDWVKTFNSNNEEIGTTYVYTAEQGLGFNAPLVKISGYVDQVATSYSDAIVIDNGTLKFASSIGSANETVKLTSEAAKNQYYCYYIYDATGALKYCGQINYADVQNA